MVEIPCPRCGSTSSLEASDRARRCPTCGRAFTVGRYRLEGVVGRGELGIVYQARRPGQKRSVAIKMLSPQASREWESREQFESGLRVLRNLTHPFLPKVYSVDQDEIGQVFLVRELLEGGSLDDRIRRARRRATPEEFLELLTSLLEVLSYLHGLMPPVLHRAIKPKNILFRLEHSWEPVLVDFDVASSPHDVSPALTGYGTRGFAAPEELRGITVPASDVYSAGAVMLFVATHIDPAQLPKKRGRFQIDTYLKGIEPLLAKLLLRMVEPDPRDRYAEGGEALRALRDTLARQQRKEDRQKTRRERALQRAAEKSERQRLAASRSGDGKSRRKPLVIAAIIVAFIGFAMISKLVRDSRRKKRRRRTYSSRTYRYQRSRSRSRSARSRHSRSRSSERVGKYRWRPCSNGCTRAQICSEGSCRLRIRSVAAGFGYTCLLAATSRVLCSGNNRDGQVGTGIFGRKAEFAANLALTSVRHLAAGSRHACAVRRNGSVWCWGKRGDGAYSQTPRKVPGVENAVEVAVGYRHACARLRSRQVRCWGRHGGVPRWHGTSPKTIPGLSDAIQISAGYYHTCALRGSGRIACWGYDTRKQLGRAQRNRRGELVTVQGIEDAVQVGAGRTHTCAVRASGSVYCWGNNEKGQAGGDPAPVRIPAGPVQGVRDALRVDADRDYSCALTSGGKVYCWGANHDGQLGTDGAERPWAREVPGIDKATAISVGWQHACAVAGEGEVYCWGGNTWGQLGRPKRRNRSEPAVFRYRP